MCVGSDDNVTRIVIGGKRNTFQLCIDKWFHGYILRFWIFSWMMMMI